MSGSTHTPGPWCPYRDEDGNIVSIMTEVAGDNGGITGKGIARMPVPVERGAKNARTTWDEINANGRLISAAPELLAALKLVWDAYGFDPSIDSSIWQTVQAALAKAEAR